MELCGRCDEGLVPLEFDREREHLTERGKEQFDRMVKVFKSCVNREQMKTMLCAYVLDRSYERPAILHAERRACFDMGWKR